MLSNQSDFGPAARCPECGGMIYVAPCLLCQLRRTGRQKPCRAASWGAGRRESLSVDLQREHRRRYEEVLAWRRLDPVRLVPSRVVPH
jgi:hypothetical protein